MCKYPWFQLALNSDCNFAELVSSLVHKKICYMYYMHPILLKLYLTDCAAETCDSIPHPGMCQWLQSLSAMDVDAHWNPQVLTDNLSAILIAHQTPK